MSSVLIYDGECRLCQALVRQLKRIDGMREVLAFSSQSGSGKDALFSAGMETADVQSIVLIAYDRIFVKSDAVLAVLERSRWGRWPAKLMQPFPRRLRDIIYDFIAARRYTVFGRTPACDGKRCQ